MRASFHSVALTRSVILIFIGLAQKVCTEEKTTASWEAIPLKEGDKEMLWILIALVVSLVALFTVLHLAAAKQMEQDIALFLSESQTTPESLMPSPNF